MEATETKELKTADRRDLDMTLSVAHVRQQVQQIQLLIKEVFVKDTHFGVIPGTKKDCLLKAGAEKLCLMFRLDPQYHSTEAYDGSHLTIKSKCTLYHITTGQRLGSGEGSCSTKESKYAFRFANRKCPKCSKETINKGKEEFGGGWYCNTKNSGCGAKFQKGDVTIERQDTGKVPNDQVADQYNTVLKMANKRSLVAATLNVTGASDIFTQDLEDDPEAGAETTVKAAPPKAAAAKSSAPVASTGSKPIINAVQILTYRGKLAGLKVDPSPDGKTVKHTITTTDGLEVITMKPEIADRAREPIMTSESVSMKYFKNNQGLFLVSAIDPAGDEVNDAVEQ